MPALFTAAFVTAAAAALGIWIALPTDAHRTTSPTMPGHVRAHLDATSDAQARQMRHATRVLARETGAGARCDAAAASARYRACVLPALRHAGIGGSTAARMLNVVINAVPFGRCRLYLLGLQAAHAGAGDAARWLLPQLYAPDSRRALHKVATGLALITTMLRHAGRAAPADVCAPGAGVPAA
jgi:hypothetical protein